MPKSKCVFLFFFIFLLSIKNFSQEKDSILNVLSNNYSQEKLYIHFDKNIYSKAETIWFKAYLLDDGLPQALSKNFYADWYDDKGNFICHNSFPIFQSSANGQFVVPDDYKGKTLHIKAYTTWMLNFDTAFLFNKTFSIYQPNSTSATTKIIKPKLEFFAEGGDIINGISSFVAFKATNQYLQPINIRGIVKNAEGQVIDSIKSEHDGMGLLYIENPNSNTTYTAYWQDDITRTNYTTTLPKVNTDGIGLQVQQLNNNIVVKLTRPADASDDKKLLHIFCFKGSTTLYQVNAKLVANATRNIEIPTANFGTGIIQITVCNANYLPLAERIVFVNNNDYSYTPSVKIELLNTTKRAKNRIEISDTSAIFSNMSAAITDATIDSDSTTNIVSHLLLTSDIKGYVHKPNYYFLNTDDSTQQNLDLVMLTNGWRKYNWQKIFNNQLPRLRYIKDTCYLSIIGNTFYDGAISNNEQVIILTQNTNSLPLILPVNSKGVFKKSNVVFYDKLKLTYSFLANKKMNGNAEVVFQNGLFNAPAKSFFDSSMTIKAEIDYAYYKKLQQYEDEYNRLSKIKGSGVLEAVTVETKKKDPKEILDEKYTSAMFTGGDAYSFDVMNDMRAQSSIDVFSYLTGTVAGLQIRQNGADVDVTWRNAKTTFFVNEMQMDAEVVSSISMNDIAYIKVFRPPFFGGFGGSPGGAIAIYTRTGEDIKTKPTKGLPNKFIDGYTAIKQFYNPNYEKETVAVDTRTTLYWNSYITPNNNTHKATIEFFNSDICKKYKLVLCGINAQGKIAFIEKMIE